MPLAVPPLPQDANWYRTGPADDRDLPREQQRARTGFLLMIIGFAILWVPYVNAAGELVVLVGVIFLWLGRFGFTETHHQLVTTGGALVLVSILFALGVVIWFAAAVASAASMPGESLSTLGSAVREDLAVLFVGSLGATTLGAMGYAALPYALADSRGRWLLLSAMGLTIGISALGVAVLLPQISNAIAQATSGAAFNNAPISALQGTEAIWGTAQILPDLMFAWAYFRIRDQLVMNPAVLL